jgi:hypothetical protein
MEPEFIFRDSALKQNVTEADIRHAFKSYRTIRQFQNRENVYLLVGFDLKANPNHFVNKFRRCFMDRFGFYSQVCGTRITNNYYIALSKACFMSSLETCLKADLLYLTSIYMVIYTNCYRKSQDMEKVTPIRLMQSGNRRE